jgi:hypothetical protein
MVRKLKAKLVLQGEVVLNDAYREIVGVASRWTSPSLWFGAHRLAAAYAGSVGRAIIG